MDESILSAQKEVLVAVVKMAQKQRLKGDKGVWKEFLSVHDGQSGKSYSDPAKRSSDDLAAFLKTFSDEGVVKFLVKMATNLSERRSLAHLSNSCTGVESPQQRLVSLTLQHPDYLVNYSFPSQNEEWAVTRLGKISKAGKSNSLVAIDCEMALCEDGTEAVVQVCVVDQNLEVKLNELVKPNKAVSDYRTHITGISAEDLEGVTCSLAHIQKKMKKLLREGTILVGHSLNSDLRALKLDHARVIDTSYIYDAPTRRKPSLNDLCKTVLGYEVRKDGSPHNCLEPLLYPKKMCLNLNRQSCCFTEYREVFPWRSCGEFFQTSQLNFRTPVDLLRNLSCLNSAQEFLPVSMSVKWLLKIPMVNKLLINQLATTSLLQRSDQQKQKTKMSARSERWTQMCATNTSQRSKDLPKSCSKRMK